MMAATMQARTWAMAGLFFLGAGCAPSTDAVDARAPERRQQALTTDFKLMTYNIKSAFATRDYMGDPSMAEFAAAIIAEDPDIVALEEISTRASGDWTDPASGIYYDDTYYEDQVLSLSELTGMPYYFHAISGDRAHSNYIDVWDGTMGLSAQGGVALLSKHPFLGEPEVLDFVRHPKSEENHPVTESNRTSGIKVTVELPVDGGTMLTDVYVAHLSSVDHNARVEQAHVIERAVDPTHASFVLGDMNAEGSELPSILGGWLDPRAGLGDFIDYPSNAPRKQIDWILYRHIEDIAVVDAHAAGGTISDHQAWVMSFDVQSQCPAFDTAAPDWDFCVPGCGPCGVGEGDCDSDAECRAGLTCAFDVGAAYGLPLGFDLCVVPKPSLTVPSVIDVNDGNLGPASVYATSHQWAASVAHDGTFAATLRYATTEDLRTASLTVDGNPVAQAVTLEDTGSFGTFSEIAFRHIPISAGAHTIQLGFDGDGVNVDYLDVHDANPGPFGQVAWQMPAFIQAEDYNVGGAGSHGSTAGNQGGVYRYDDIDIYTKDSHGQAEGGYRVVFAPGDWTEYKVDVAEDDDFDMTLRYASLFPSGTRVKMTIDGVDNGTFDLAQTSSGMPAVYTDLLTPLTHYTAGKHNIRLESVGSGGFSLDALRFAREWTGPIKGTPWDVPGIIEAENYDLVDAWSDTTPGNDGAVLRWDDVDLWFGADNIGNHHFVWQTAAGEYLEYTVDVAEDPLGLNLYDVSVRYATTRSGKTVSILCDGAPVVSALALAPTCGWGSDGTCWGIATKTYVTLNPGVHVLRLVFDTGLNNVDYISIQPSSVLVP